MSLEPVHKHFLSNLMMKSALIDFDIKYGHIMNINIEMVYIEYKQKSKSINLSSTKQISKQFH